MNRECNCRNKEKCVYNGKCRSQIVVYCAECELTGKKYIGNTQQQVKKRMQQHKNDVKNRVVKGKLSDSFAAHFAQLVPTNTPDKDITGNIKFKVEILWQGNPLSCVRTFGTSTCKLCAKERLAILKLTRRTPHLAINKCTEIYGACRHKPNFHRFDFIKDTTTNKVSTDEATNAERVPQRQCPLSTSSTTSTTNSSLASSSRSTTYSFPSPPSSTTTQGWNSDESLADAIWLSLNPDLEEPPIIDATDMRITVFERT
jgi:GIY-YIG catalytic domain